MKKYLIAGLLVWVPLGVTIVVIRFILDLMDRMVTWIPEVYQPTQLLGHTLPGVSLMLIVLLLFVTGFVVTNFLGKRLVAAYESLLNRIPLVRSVYQGVKQSLTVILSKDNKAFREVLLVQYPKAGVWSIAFKTSDQLPQLPALQHEPHVMVFVPTTPNPTSGFLVMVAEKDTLPLDITVDQALKCVISLGTVSPYTNSNIVQDHGADGS